MSEASPYLGNAKRLADVMAAIQFLGAHKYGSRSIENWSNSLGTSPKSANSWMEIFQDHPEFFRVKSGYVALVLRRAKQKNYHMETGEFLTEKQIDELSEKEKKKVTRKHLESTQIEALLNTAIQMHASAIAHEKELRWWIPLLASLIGVVIGAVLKS